ncbi:MAG: flagellar basal body rod protein FlgB [Magnetococcales bacterium]|nr:flagellar basal body rod protein FlgB [Magnetococcales bacterium]
MPGFGLLGETGAFKANLLNLRQRRQEIIASNVANAETPGYKARRFNFEDALKEAMPEPGMMPMARTRSGHMPLALDMATVGEVQEVEATTPKADGNSVELEQEMGRQTANQLLYNYAAQSLGTQIKLMQSVIQGGTGG